ncbi:MAG: TolC family protein [bacterium]
MKKMLFIVCFTSMNFYLGNSQDTINLFECFKLANEAVPSYEAANYIREIDKWHQLNTRKKWLPSINLEASASYQSDVTSIDFENLPNFQLDFPVPPKDQYNMYLSLNQLIYDGGAMRYEKELSSIQAGISLLENEEIIYQMKEQVENVYFSILFLNSNERWINEFLQEMKIRVNLAESGVKNEIFPPADY